MFLDKQTKHMTDEEKIDLYRDGYILSVVIAGISWATLIILMIIG